MRIAQIAPLYEATPPTLYGGTERVVATLTDALIKLGHDVTLFGTADSGTMAKLVACRDRAIRLDPELSWDLPAHLTMMEEVRRRADEFDILHFHTDCLQMAMFGDMAEKTVTTLHGRQDIEDMQRFLRRFPEFPLVAISRTQQSFIPSANVVSIIHHGMDANHLTPVEKPTGDYLAFLGRISPEKRPDRAIRIARQASVPLRIAAKVSDADKTYFHEVIEPMLGDGVEFIGEINDSKKAEFLGNARALLFPIDWPEPFGLVMIEAMACGTPVIAFPNGAATEVVEDAITGHLVNSIDEGVSAVYQTHRFDRRLIRSRFLQRFSDVAMAKSYVAAYETLIEAAPSSDDALAETLAPRALVAAEHINGAVKRPAVQ